ncbi:hypothetical protein E4K67_20455 [Desulfosporosinus fructosivorans]|uniref:DUF1640 domain-containing protein n=1 Tax=Desulfosporosinus fructosivorans TaxID=2018669 RepID=A0A4Z0R3W0_9FIRM|nr:hypothetical protein [Desulfosporosinus fructosivorans]TGE36306.1 hypothetical protein E4K67_20455 [Desulfosporosinus fructosivorans]
MVEQKVLEMLNELMGEIKKTRADLTSEITQTRADLTSEITQTRADLSSEITQTRTDLSNEILQTRTDLSNEILQTRADLSSEITQTRADLSGEINTIKSEVGRNRILLEEVQNQIKTVAEGVTSLREQTVQQFETLTHYVNEKTSLLEKVIRNDVAEAKHIKGILGEHEVSIRHLKSKSL